MNAKKLLSTLLSAAMAVSMLAGCFGGGGNKNYSDEAADAANAAQSTVVFSTDATLAKSLQDALADGLTQLDEIDDAMEADENLKPLLTSGWDLDIFAAQGEDAEAAAKTIAEQYIVSAVIGKKAEGKIAMVLHDGNGYYYVAVLTYGSGGSGSGGGAGGGSGSGDDHRPGGGDDDKPGPDDNENNPDNIYTLTGLTVTGPTDTEYWVDETFSTDGMTITAVYTNKKGDTKTESVDIHDVIIDDKGPYEDIDVGTKEISISYTEDGVTVSDTVSITVKAHELVSISVTNPDKTTYEVGETFESAGMTVTGTYKNGDNSTIEKPIDLNKCIFTPKLFWDDVAGQEVTVTVSYTEGEKTATDTVTVNVKELYVQRILDVDLEEEYDHNTSINKNSVTVTVEYNNGTTGELKLSDSGFTVTPEKFTTTGDVKVTIVYKQDGYAEVSYEDTVKVNPTVENVKVELKDDVIIYQGEKVEADDLKVTVTDSNGKDTVLNSNEFTVTNWDTDEAGTGSVTITYNGESYNGNITVTAKQHTITMVYDGDLGSGEESVTVEDNGSTEIAVTPKTGYKVSSAVVTSSDSSDATVSCSGNKVTVSNVTDDVTITVYFEAIQYTVTVKTNGGDANCTVTPTEGTVSVENPNFEFTVTVSDGYSARVVTSDNVYNVVAGSDGESYTVYTKVTGDVTVTVNFDEKQPVLTGLKVELKNSKAFFVGDTLKKSDLNVYPIYDGVPSETPLNDSDFTISGTTHFTDAKKYTITVNHKGVTGTVDVHVKEVKVSGISLINPDSTITRHARTVLPHDTFFYIWDGNYIGAGLEICDDIKIIRKYNNGESDDSALTPSELEDLIEAGVIWSNHDYKFYDYEAAYDYITVTISYQDKGMSKPVTTQINVTVKWNTI